MKRRNRTIFSRYQAPDRRVVEAADYSIGELGGVSDADWGDLGHNLVQGPTDPREVDAWEDERDNGLQRFIDGLPDNEKMVLPEAWLDHHASHRTAVDNDDERDADEEAWQSKNDDTSDADADAVSDSQMADSDFAQKYQYDKDDDSKKESSRLVELSRREASLLQAMPHANLTEARQIMAELNDIKIERNAIHQASRDLDLANAVVADHLTPVVSTMSRSSAASDWLAEIETPHVGSFHSDSLRVEADLWWGRTHPDVKADTTELVTQALGYSRIFTSSYADPEGAQMIFMERIVSLAEAHPAQEPAEDGAADSTLPDAVNPTDAPETFDQDTLSSTSRRAQPIRRAARIEREAAGVGDWPRVPSKNFPGEMTPSCPKCGSTEVHLTGNNLGSDVVRGNYYNIVRCGSCGYQEVTPGSPPKQYNHMGEEVNWRGQRVNSSHHTASETCPSCGGPIEVYPGDKDGITVYFECKNPNCKAGKLSEADWAKIRSFSVRRTAAKDGDTCEVCGKALSSSEISRLNQDTDFVEHDGHTIRVAPKTASRRTASNVDMVRQIAQNQQAQEIDGVLVDMQTASLLVQILDNLSPENQAKISRIIESDIARAGEIAWKLMSKNSSKTAADEPTDTGAASSSLPVAINPTDAPESLDPLSTDPNAGPGPIQDASGSGSAPGSAFAQYVSNASKLAAFQQRVAANRAR